MSQLQKFQPIIETYMPAIQVFTIGVVVSIGIYLIIEWIFRITGIERILLKFFGQRARIWKDALPKAIGKYIAVFVFLLFLRAAVDKTGYHEVEQFLSHVVDYLPHLLLALLITFFGIQSSNTAHNLIYNAVRFESKKTAALLGNLWRVVILFFTFSITLGQINAGVEIIPPYLVISILIGVVAAASIAFGLAFGLGGKEAATKIINDFLMKKKEPEKLPEKNLKK